MKKQIFITVLVIAAAFASCSNNPQPNPSNSTSTIGKFIPNWSNDTLVCIYQESTGGPMKYDSLFSYSRGDTSLVKYKGVEYYLWTKPTDQIQEMNPGWFVQDGLQYSYCYFGLTPMDNSSAIIGSLATSAVPHKYYDSSTQTWKSSPQSLLVNPRKPPFPNNVFTGGDLFSTSNK